MNIESKTDYVTARRVLATFAQYGFKKTAMDDVAKAMGVSRQSVYKRFGNKVLCYAWVIDTYLGDIYGRAFTALAKDDVRAEETLQTVFDILIGEAIDIINLAHGTEVLDDCLQAAEASPEDWLLGFRARLADYLARHQVVPAEKAPGIAFVLMSAGKGLLLQGNTRAQFHQDIRLIIDSVKH